MSHFTKTLAILEILSPTPVYVKLPKRYRLVLTKRYHFGSLTVFFTLIFFKIRMAIYRPKVVMKSKPTCAGDKEHGAEVICLHEDDYNHQGDPDFFPIKLAYNGIHHYLPIVQRSVCTFLDDYNSAMYHIKNARYKLKKLNGHMPEGCTLAKVVKIAYTASVTTAEVLNGCNPVGDNRGSRSSTYNTF